jgi:hypothetical protein
VVEEGSWVVERVGSSGEMAEWSCMHFLLGSRNESDRKKDRTRQDNAAAVAGSLDGLLRVTAVFMCAIDKKPSELWRDARPVPHKQSQAT